MPANPLILTRLGWGIAIPVAFLLVVGLACIHATDRDEDPSKGYQFTDPAASALGDESGSPVQRALSAIGTYTVRQVLFVISGIALMFVAMRTSYQKLGEYAYIAYALAILLLLALVVDKVGVRYGIDLPLIKPVRNTWRWIQLGPFTLQPSEFMKVVLILTLARYLRYRSSYRTWRGLIPPFLLTLAPMVLIHMQPDLGTLLMLLPVLFSMLLVAGARLRHLATIVVVGCSILPLFYFFGMQEYQKQRIDVLFRQNSGDERWQANQGYQLRQSKTALGTGGVFGEGYHEGVFVQYDLLPEEHTDFIFAIIGHQWGLIGCVLILAAYALIVLVGVEVAFVTNDPFGRLLVVGVLMMIVIQAIINISMAIGLAPITGMPLPFVSYGGSSLWANFLALGLLINVAQRRPMLIAHPPFEYGD